jgi:hypothetical protein
MTGMGVSELIVFALTVAVVLFVCNFIVGLVRRTSKPVEPEPNDLAGVPAKLRPRPKSGAGAVALEEPDDDDEYSD